MEGESGRSGRSAKMDSGRRRSIVPCRATLECDQVWPVLLQYSSSAPCLSVPPRRIVLCGRQPKLLEFYVSHMLTCFSVLFGRGNVISRHGSSRFAMSSIMIHYASRDDRSTGIKAPGDRSTSQDFRVPNSKLSGFMHNAT